MPAELVVGGLCPSSVSVVRPSVASIISEPIAWIPFKFWLLPPLGHMPDPVLILCFVIFFTNIFRFVNMGRYGSQNFKTLLLLQILSQPKVFKLFLNFRPNGPHKATLGIFEILKIEILMIFFFFFLNMGPYKS